MKSMKLVAAALVFVAPLAIGAQQQSPNPRSGWPCGARLDTSYFQVAEGSGGHLLLLAPEEIGDSATLLMAFGSHTQTIFRLAGSLKPGLHEPGNRPMRNVHQGAGRFDDVQMALAQAIEGVLRRSVRGDHHRWRGHV